MARVRTDAALVSSCTEREERCSSLSARSCAACWSGVWKRPDIGNGNAFVRSGSEPFGDAHGIPLHTRGFSELDRTGADACAHLPHRSSGHGDRDWARERDHPNDLFVPCSHRELDCRGQFGLQARTEAVPEHRLGADADPDTRWTTRSTDSSARSRRSRPHQQFLSACDSRAPVVPLRAPGSHSRRGRSAR